MLEEEGCEVGRVEGATSPPASQGRTASQPRARGLLLARRPARARLVGRTGYRGTWSQAPISRAGMARTTAHPGVECWWSGAT